MKKCTKCNEAKPLTEYYRHARVPGGYLNKCKVCAREDEMSRAVPRTCTECGKGFKALTSEIKRRGGGANTCSRECYYKRLPKLMEVKNSGMRMSYAGVHQWIKRVKGQPQECEECTTKEGLIDWSNISGQYKRDIDDWRRLCRKCHIKADDHPNKRKETLMQRYGTLNTRKLNQKGG